MMDVATQDVGAPGVDADQWRLYERTPRTSWLVIGAS